MVHMGEPQEVAERYLEINFGRDPEALNEGERHGGDGDARVVDVWVEDEANIFDESGDEVGGLRAGRLVGIGSDGFSDTEKDPHSPLFWPNAGVMMLQTKHRYDAYAYKREQPEARFEGGVPEWPFLDRLSQSWFTRIPMMKSTTGLSRRAVKRPSKTFMTYPFAAVPQ